MLNWVGQSLIFAGLFSVLGMQAVWADLSRVNNRPKAVTTEKEWVAQIETAIAEVTAVKFNPTQQGLQIVLETAAEEERLVPLILQEGEDLIIDILDTTLASSIRNGVEK
ncbi:AMIN domain-containing protein [Pleurocapsales cyanobacterium LEGE 06147]|nr:AMIN domain-containing protein [Pleurocapsales cyanobacterium LEGE 06147]